MLLDVPPSPQLWAQDITPEKLGPLMAEQGGSMSLLSDEGGMFATIMGRYVKGDVNVDLILKGHSGSSVSIHRVGSGHVYIPRAILTIGVVPQPITFSKLAKIPGLAERGFFARFLFCFPQSLLGFRSLKSIPIYAEVTEAYSQALQSLLNVEPPENGGLHCIKLSPEALGEWQKSATK